MLGQDLPSPDEPRPSETLENDSGSVEDKSEPSTSSSSSNARTESNLRLENSDVLAKGISSMLSAVIRDFDCKAENAAKSQDELSSVLDRLTRELDQLLEDAPLPFIMQHAAKISGVRKRVASLNTLLKSIQRRIDNIDRMLSAGLSHGSEAKTSSDHVKSSVD